MEIKERIHTTITCEYNTDPCFSVSFVLKVPSC